jgi:hypothetical protein
MQRMFSTGESESRSFGDISRYANAPIPDTAIKNIVELLGACQVRTAAANGSIWSLEWVGGAVNLSGQTLLPTSTGPC